MSGFSDCFIVLEITTFLRFARGRNLFGMDSYVLRPMITTFLPLPIVSERKNFMSSSQLQGI